MLTPQLMFGDCLEIMPIIPDHSVDLILCDLPYEKTACAWDKHIPLAKLWPEYLRIIKRGHPILLTAIQPFTSLLVMSQPHLFKYDWTWEKTTATGHLNCKKMPLRAHETVLIFCDGTPRYYPQKTSGHTRKTALRVDRGQKLSECYGSQKGVTHYDSTERFPRSVIKTSTDKQKSKLHPTQKPVALMEYLIRTYSNAGDVVLDNAMGSGTTGVACVKNDRKFIGIEKDESYFKIACNRISRTDAPTREEHC